MKSREILRPTHRRTQDDKEMPQDDETVEKPFLTVIARPFQVAAAIYLSAKDCFVLLAMTSKKPFSTVSIKTYDILSRQIYSLSNSWSEFKNKHK